MNLAIERLDPRNADALVAYERAFHRAFQRVPGNRLVRTLWHFDDDAGRVATRIDYEDQLLLVKRDASGAIETAMGVNIAMRQFQSGAYGFEAPRDPAGICELLAFFTVGDGALARALRFWEGCCNELRALGFHTALATTGPRPLPTYLHIGGELVETREIASEQRFFLRFDLARHWMRRGRVKGEG